eukprot:s47_g20.t1
MAPIGALAAWPAPRAAREAAERDLAPLWTAAGTSKVERAEQLRKFLSARSNLEHSGPTKNGPTLFDFEAAGQVGGDLTNAMGEGASAAAPAVGNAAQAGAEAAMSGAQAAAPMDAASSAAGAVMSGAQAAAPMVGDAASSLAGSLGDAANSLGDSASDGSCFPATATVFEKHRGIIHMASVRIGDRLASGAGDFSEVIAFLHFDPEATTVPAGVAGTLPEAGDFAVSGIPENMDMNMFQEVYRQWLETALTDGDVVRQNGQSVLELMQNQYVVAMEDTVDTMQLLHPVVQGEIGATVADDEGREGRNCISVVHETGALVLSSDHLISVQRGLRDSETGQRRADLLQNAAGESGHPSAVLRVAKCCAKGRFAPLTDSGTLVALHFGHGLCHAAVAPLRAVAVLRRSGFRLEEVFAAAALLFSGSCDRTLHPFCAVLLRAARWYDGSVRKVRDSRATPAGAYARRQLFSLLLELQEQIKQDLERSTAAEQRVVATWNLREALASDV